MSNELPEMLDRTLFLSDVLLDTEIGDGRNTASAERLLGLELSYATLLYLKKQGQFTDAEVRGGSILGWTQTSLMKAYVETGVVNAEAMTNSEIADDVVKSVFGEFL